MDLYLSGSCSINRERRAEAGSIYVVAAGAAGTDRTWSLTKLQQRRAKTTRLQEKLCRPSYLGFTGSSALSAIRRPALEGK
jgi:hypothetical protein